jgi:periplasmic protein TonB
MSTSQFCIQQRQQEQQRVRKLLWLGLAASIVLHGILALALPRQLATKQPQVKKPMELILVDKPKPKPKPKPKETKITPKPKPEPPQQKAPEPKPEPPAPQPKPEPPQQKAPEPKPEPPQPQPLTPQAKKAPAPKKVLTSNLPPVSKAFVAPKPERAIALSPANNPPTVKESSSNVASSNVATNSPPSTGESESTESAGDESGIACVNNCEPEYPAVLNGAEGNASVKLTLDNNGNVIGVAIANSDNNIDVNRQALLAARQMEFSSPGAQEATVIVNINFTVEGSEFNRIVKERQEQQAARQQQQLEAEKQAQQERLNQEREARTIQKQQSIPNTSTESKPLPPLAESELEQERLKKFRERIQK